MKTGKGSRLSERQENYSQSFCNRSVWNDLISLSPMSSSAVPPNNRDPLPEEIDTCKPFLLQQIELIHPKLVCTLGNFATQTLLERKVGITKVRGQVIQLEHFVVFPLLHPAAALHQGNLRVPLKEDFKKLKAVLDDMSKTPSLPNTSSPASLSTPQEATKDTPAEPPTQMSLF